MSEPGSTMGGAPAPSRIGVREGASGKAPGTTWFGRSLARTYAAVWADPERTIRTLESYAETEADGGRDIAVAVRRTADPVLREHFARHARDEQRHAELFRRRALELRERHPEVGAADRDARLCLDHSRERGRSASETDAHGFLLAGLMDELGEVAYVGMLHVAEQRAAALFTLHHELTAHDPQTRAIFESILRDEQYHVAYTRATLEQWKQEGRGAEVRAALSAARGQRLLGAWRRLGLRSAAGLGRVLMLAAYWTLCLPFGLAARSGHGRGAGLREPLARRPGEHPLRSQY